MLRTVTAGPDGSPSRSGAAARRSGRTRGGYGARPPSATDESLDGSAAEPPGGSLDEFTAELFDESAAERLGGVPRGRGTGRSGCGLGAGR
ncbi:hypothetical protein ACIPX0_30050 [Streptomyces sp. NPDC090075]|uniref:hypothetical protein n=1 Tax=Streptomyces sp. NPDC090075 TaxID=3365937 RepID=UPI00382E6619